MNILQFQLCVEKTQTGGVKLWLVKFVIGSTEITPLSLNIPDSLQQTRVCYSQVSTVTKTVKIIRLGHKRDTYLVHVL